MSLPHVVAKMGDGLREVVTRQLIKDFLHYYKNHSLTDLTIDWSNACQEGHCTTVLGGELEEVSDVVVLTPSGHKIAEGWMDFVHGGGSNPLHVFWLFLDILDGPNRQDIKAEPFIPEHIWNQLPVVSKNACAVINQYDCRWKDDPKVIAWRQKPAV